MRELKQYDEVMSQGKSSDGESKSGTTGVTSATNADNEKIFQMGNFFWSPEENPELDLPILNENDNEVWGYWCEIHQCINVRLVL